MKKNYILTLCVIISLSVLIFLTNFVYHNFFKNNSEDFTNSLIDFSKSNEKPIFIIDKITYFSSSDADINTNYNYSFAISNLIQYTDIAISLAPYNQETLTEENTLKEVEISDIEYSLTPTNGKPSLYYKNINQFSTSNHSKTLIENSIKFNTTSEDTLDYDTPTLYNNCANPITFCYINENILDKTFTLQNSISNIKHDGSLLKKCNITLNSLACKINCTVNITNNKNEHFTCPLTLDIPLSTENSTIYDGSLTYKDSTKHPFLKISD